MRIISGIVKSTQTPWLTVHKDSPACDWRSGADYESHCGNVPQETI